MSRSCGSAKFDRCTVMAEGWSRSNVQREDTVRRMAANFAAIVFSKGGQINDAEALQAATGIEKKAYIVASVEAKTTTGQRPAEETEQAYIRCNICLQTADVQIEHKLGWPRQPHCASAMA